MYVWVSAPLAHSRVSNINFDIWFFCFEGGLYKYPIKIYIKDGKVLAHLEIKSKVLSWHLTDWNACVGLCTSSPQQVVKYQLWYLILVLEGGLYKYSMKNILRTTKSLPTWGVDQRYCAGLYLTEVPEWVSAPQTHSRVSTINFDIWNCVCGVGLYKYPMKNILRTATFLPTWGFNQRYWPGL